METLIMHPQNKEQLDALKAFAKALNVPFDKNEVELTDREKGIKLYGVKMVEDIEEAEEDIKAGRVTRVKKENLKAFLGL